MYPAKQEQDGTPLWSWQTEYNPQGLGMQTLIGGFGGSISRGSIIKLNIYIIKFGLSQSQKGLLNLSMAYFELLNNV